MLLNIKNKNITHFASEKDFFNFLYQESCINGTLLSLGRLLHRAALHVPDTVALIFQDISITYYELYYRAALLSIKLYQNGIRPHHKVVLLFPNSPEFFVGYCAIIQIGAVVIPLNTFLHEKEFSHIINNSDPHAMIVGSEFIPKIPPREANLSRIIFTEQDIDWKSNVPDVIPSIPLYDLQPNDLAVLLYTSGTTGTPKGVMLSSKNCIINVLQSIARIGLGLEQNERVLAVLPLFHSFSQNTCVWSILFTGSTVILMPKIERKAILKNLIEHTPTIFLGVPALYGLLCLLKNAPLENIKYFICGGDALSDKIRMMFALLYRRKICNGYGLTETAPVVAIELEDELLPVGTIGRPLVGIKAVIKDEHNAVLPQGSIGELWVKGDNVMMGYYKEPELTEQAIQNEWFATGDLAYFDQDDRLVIIGREKDVIAHKGFKIYPQEIENILLSHSAIIRAAVIGKEEESVGETIVAFIQVKNTYEALEQELKRLCQNSLATYKIPRIFIFVTQDLPTTTTGKIDKKQLRKQLEAIGK